MKIYAVIILLLLSQSALAEGLDSASPQDLTQAELDLKDRLDALNFYQNLIEGKSADVGQRLQIESLKDYQGRNRDVRNFLRGKLKNQGEICTLHFSTDLAIHDDLLKSLDGFQNSKSEEKLLYLARARNLETYADTFFRVSLSEKINEKGTLLVIKSACFEKNQEALLNSLLDLREKSMKHTVQSIMGYPGLLHLHDLMTDLAQANLHQAIQVRNTFFRNTAISLVFFVGVPFVLARTAFITIQTLRTLKVGLYLSGAAGGVWTGFVLGKKAGDVLDPNIEFSDWKSQIGTAKQFLDSDLESPGLYLQILDPLIKAQTTINMALAQSQKAEFDSLNWFQKEKSIPQAIQHTQDQLDKVHRALAK